MNGLGGSNETPNGVRLTWEDEVKVTDGTSCGFDTPQRHYKQGGTEAAE
jgi:hypothetical protein